MSINTNIHKVFKNIHSYFIFNFQAKCVNIDNNKTFQLYAEMLWHISDFPRWQSKLCTTASKFKTHTNQFGFNYHYRIFLILSKPTLLHFKTFIDWLEKMFVFFHICGGFLRFLYMSMVFTSFQSSFSPSHPFLIHPNPS